MGAEQFLKSKSVNTYGMGHGRDYADWECSDDVKDALRSMGLYDDMLKVIQTVRGSFSDSAIKLAKNKLDALQTAIAVIEKATKIYKSTGAEDSEKGFSKVEVAYTFEEDEEPEEDTES